MPPGSVPGGLMPPNAFNENNFMSEEELPDPASDLTQEDEVFLSFSERLDSPLGNAQFGIRYNSV